MAVKTRTAGILTVSDRCSRGESKDTSGPNLVKILSSHSDKLCLSGTFTTDCIPDDKELIQKTLIDWVDVKRLSLILTTGGTGFSPSDITPESTKPLLDKEAPGLTFAMITKSLEITPMAMLSRPACGIRKQSLIINLPGSKKGSEECVSFILPSLPHALDLINESSNVLQTHGKMMTSHQSHDHHMHHTCSHGNKIIGKRSKEDFHPVALRPRQSPYPLVSIDDAINMILQNTPSCLATENKALKDALNCVLAESLIADQPFPPFPASIKDGYAVISADGPGEREVIAPILAGEISDIMVESGCVARITTGAPLPPGADAVIMVENTELIASSDDGTIEKRIKLLTSVKPGEDVRSIGSDVAKGDVVLESGVLLGPYEIGLAASIGMTSLNVFKTPKVAVLSTGNEVVDPGNDLKFGQIYDSNHYTLLSSLHKNCFDGIDIGIAKDTREELVCQISKGFDKADVLITSGGVSMGEKDLLKPVLESDFGATIHFGRVFMKPGKPTTFATLTREGHKKLVFALPGNPVSANVTFQLFVLPALKKLAGHTELEPITLSAKVKESIVLDPRPEYHRVKVNWSRDDASGSLLPYVTSTGGQRSSRLLSMKGASGLLVLPPKSSERTFINVGETVKVMLLS